MGYLLLWIENLVVSCLFVALITACLGRLRSRRRQLAGSVSVVLLMFAGYAALTGFEAGLEFGNRIRIGWFRPLLLLTLVFIAGASSIARRGMRLAPGSATVPAADWARDKLGLALMAAVAMQLMTFWNLDAAVTQKLAVLRTEAGALAVSAAPRDVDDGDNAAFGYQMVIEAMGLGKDWPKVWNDAITVANDPQSPQNALKEGVAEFDFAGAELGRFLERHAAELTLLRQAADKPGCRFDRNYAQPGFDMLLPEIQDMRLAVQLLAVHARSQAAGGMLRSALADVHAMYAIAVHVGSEPFLVSMMVAADIDRLARDTLVAVLSAARPTEQDLDAIRIDAKISYRRLLNRSLRMEEALFLTEFSSLGDSRRFDILFAVIGVSKPPPFPGFGPLYRVFLLSDDAAAYREFMHLHQQTYTRPYVEAKARWEGLDAEMQQNKPGILTSLLAPAITKCNEKAIEADAARRLAQVALA
ncbi:MAG TPA: hypothetical protein VND64_35075, partial [Pirellulales bacterium]|nr:hypothetical protein [Pirellulales bacterium]